MQNAELKSPLNTKSTLHIKPPGTRGQCPVSPRGPDPPPSHHHWAPALSVGGDGGAYVRQGDEGRGVPAAVHLDFGVMRARQDAHVDPLGEVAPRLGLGGVRVAMHFEVLARPDGPAGLPSVVTRQRTWPGLSGVARVGEVAPPGDDVGLGRLRWRAEVRLAQEGPEGQVPAIAWARSLWVAGLLVGRTGGPGVRGSQV